MAEEEDIYEYTVNIIGVKMSVKFPCKMRLEMNGVEMSPEIQSNQSHKFIFNQEITLKQDPEKSHFELQVSLLTEKGGKYIAGILKIQYTQLRSEGETITIPLTKCLDNQAYCELRIDQLSTSKVSKKPINKTSQIIPIRTTLRSQLNNQQSPNQRMRTRMTTQQPYNAETRSELHFPLTNKRPKQDWQDNRTKLNAAQSNFNRNVTRSPHYLGIDSHAHIQHMSAVVDRDKLIEAEVYKDGYNKLKEKYKKQAEIAKTELNKRIVLQNSQNNLKLQIMRLKLRTEQQEKNLNDKNLKIKELQGQISNFQKKQLDLVYLKEQYSSKDHTIRMLQDSTSTLTRDLEEMRAQGNQRSLRDAEKIKQLKRQLQNLKQRSEAKETQLDRELKNKIESLRIKQIDLQNKNQLLNRQKKAVDDLQRDAQSKVIQFQRTIQMEKATSKGKLDDIKSKLDKSQKERQTIEQQRNSIFQQLEKTKAMLIKTEYQTKILVQQTQSQAKELTEMRVYKEKHSDLVRDLKLITDDRNHLHKQLQRALQNKEINLSQLSKQHQDQIEYFKKVNKELDEKQKVLLAKVLQLEGLIEIGKTAQEKLRRGQQSLNNQLSQCREKQKTLKKNLKTKEQQVLAFENQISTMKQKNKSSDHFMKHQIQQYKEQLQRLRTQYEQQSMKNVSLSQNISQLNVQLGKVRVRLQFMEQKAQKDSKIIQQKKEEIENLSRQYQSQIASLNDLTNTLRQNEKELTTKFQKQQIELLRTQDKLDRTIKQQKVLGQKLVQAESNIKNKSSEGNTLQTIKNEMEAKISQLTQELAFSENQINQLQAQKTKNLKVIQIIQEQNSKNKKQIQQFKHLTEEKEKYIDQLLGNIKKNKQDITKLEIKFTTLSTEYQKFREAMLESLNNSFSPPLNDAKKYLGTGFNIQSFTNKKRVESTPSEINYLILSLSKDTKVVINKIGENCKQLQRENQRINDELTGSINKGQTTEYDLNKQIQQLQQELSEAYSKRDQQNINFDITLKELNSKIRQKDRQILDLTEQVQELNFSLSTINLDFEAQSDQNHKKNAQMKRHTQQLQENITLLTKNNANLEEKIFNLETERETILGQLKEEKQNSFKISRNLSDSTERNTQLQRLLEEGKKHKKDYIEKNSDLQIQLNSQKDNHEKTKQLLEEEESKSLELKGFINNLMKQKEQIIKKQLQKGQEINNLQNILAEVTRERDQHLEEIQRLTKLNEDVKEVTKKTSGGLKDVEMRLVEQKNKNQKLNEKLKEKEKEIINRDQTIEKLEVKFNRLSQRNIKQGNQLRQELELKNNQIIQVTQEYSEKCFQYEKEKQGLQNVISALKAEISAYEEQISVLKQTNGTNYNDLEQKGLQVEQLRARVNELTIQNDSMNQQLREKQQITYELQGKIYNLEARLDSKQNQRLQKINLLDNDWGCKFEGMCEEYEQRIQLIQKDRQYFKTRLQEQQDESKKILSQKSSVEIEDGRIKSVLESKIKKLQQERLQLVSQKNSEIQKLSQQVKMQVQINKSKDLQSRKTLHQLEVARITISKMDAKAKQNQDKIKNLNKVYQAQIQQFKKKQHTYQTFREEVDNKQWCAERDVRKVLQGFIKKSIEICEDTKTAQKMMDVVRNFEQTVVEAMKFNIEDVK